MTLDPTPLRKILELEKARGFSNRAVIGGLDRFLVRWVGPVAQGIGQPGLLRRLRELHLLEPRYSQWDPARRQQWLEQVLAFLPELEQNHPSPTAGHTASVPALRSARAAEPRPARPPEVLAGVPLDSPVGQLPRARALAEKLSRLGVATVRDLLYFFPRRHLDYSRIQKIAGLEVGQEQTVIASVWEARTIRLGQRPGTEATVGDETGNIRAVWFNQPYLAKRFPPNTTLVLSGRVGHFQGWKVLENPQWEFLEEDLVHTGRLVPLYPLTEGLYPRQLRGFIKGVVDALAPQLPEFLPPQVQGDLLPLPQAILQAHFPESPQAQLQARSRLAFDELFLLQLGMLSRRQEWQAQPGPQFQPRPAIVQGFVKALPFALTPAQERAWGEIQADLLRPQPMSRLLQGEVGSGKTVVAALALALAWANGWQGALMAPTEILAEQHYRTLASLLGAWSSPRPPSLALLVGSQPPKEKEKTQGLLARGEIDIVVGTHALFQEGVAFHRLGLAVVDEQHRFGVLQRSALKGKGLCPHTLVMTATPIPRTLALTVFGDLDLSVIDQLPPGRQPVKTRWLGPEGKEKAHSFIRQRVAVGEQAFIICPLIEESEVLEVPSATAEYQRLSQEVFPDLHLGLLHGRLGTQEKEETMCRFREGKLDILVATPVVEVGIDVPNATVMLVEGAERFGLSQLHQFRGRVGRGEKPSHCILLSEKPTPEAEERLAILERVHDGFVLAEEDLRLRGPGEFFGTRQSGLPDLRMARLSDLPLVERARGEARRLFEQDGRLEPYPLLREELARRWRLAAEAS